MWSTQSIPGDVEAVLWLRCGYSLWKKLMVVIHEHESKNSHLRWIRALCQPLSSWCTHTWSYSKSTLICANCYCHFADSMKHNFGQSLSRAHINTSKFQPPLIVCCPSWLLSESLWGERIIVTCRGWGRKHSGRDLIIFVNSTSVHNRSITACWCFLYNKNKTLYLVPRLSMSLRDSWTPE